MNFSPEQLIYINFQNIIGAQKFVQFCPGQPSCRRSFPLDIPSLLTQLKPWISQRCHFFCLEKLYSTRWWQLTLEQPCNVFLREALLILFPEERGCRGFKKCAINYHGVITHGTCYCLMLVIFRVEAGKASALVTQSSKALYINNYHFAREHVGNSFSSFIVPKHSPLKVLHNFKGLF
jgi:hypothetical protein